MLDISRGKRATTVSTKRAIQILKIIMALSDELAATIPEMPVKSQSEIKAQHAEGTAYFNEVLHLMQNSPDDMVVVPLLWHDWVQTKRGRDLGKQLNSEPDEPHAD